MKSLQDTLYNWLTIKVVSDERPDDTAAQETEQMFAEMLIEEHGVTNIKIETDAVMYYLQFVQNGEQKTTRFPRELIDVMLIQINSEPEKYANYPQED